VGLAPSTTVVPVSAPVKWPTLMPGTSVIALFWPVVWAQVEPVITVINNKATARGRLDVIVLSVRRSKPARCCE
jgi:hypothetical protein